MARVHLPVIKLETHPEHTIFAPRGRVVQQPFFTHCGRIADGWWNGEIQHFPLLLAPAVGPACRVCDSRLSPKDTP